MKRWKQRPEGSNWGDFGEDDQRGRINLLTPAMRKAAAAEVQEGLAFCLSLPLDYPGGNGLIKSRRAPRLFCVERETGEVNYNYAWRGLTCQHNHLDVTSDDAVTLFTQYSTQWDGLSHYGQFFDADGDGEAESVYYNGWRAGEHVVAPAAGSDEPRAARLGIENFAEAAPQGRGTLVDLHAIYGTERVAVGYDALMRAIDAQKAEVRPGDFLCLYTGFDAELLAMRKTPDPKRLRSICPGLDGTDRRLLQWITDAQIVAVAADNTAVEIPPHRKPGDGSDSILPLHAHCLFRLGMHIGELWYLQELAAWLRTHGRSSFQLTAPPLRLPGSVGSPVTPIATV